RLRPSPSLSVACTATASPSIGTRTSVHSSQSGLIYPPTHSSDSATGSTPDSKRPPTSPRPDSTRPATRYWALRSPSPTPVPSSSPPSCRSLITPGSPITSSSITFWFPVRVYSISRSPLAATSAHRTSTTSPSKHRWSSVGTSRSRSSPRSAPPASSASADAPWTLHASGTLSELTTEQPFDLTAWPPSGASEVDLGGLYQRLAETGLVYGPAFQGLTRAWMAGTTRFAEVHLPKGTPADGFAIHPAILDAALHTLLLGEDLDGIALPFAWSGVSVHATGATTIRVRLTATSTDNSFALDVADAVGQPLASIASLAA